MRPATLILAGAFGLLASAAVAAPFPATPLDDAADAAVTAIHHKPGHRGGPPWARRQQPAYERYGYDRPVRSVQSCRTTTRTQVDPFTGDTVRRSVRVCD